MVTTTTDIDITYEVYIGEDKSLVFTVRDKAGEAQNIAGFHYSFEVRLSRSHPDTIISKTNISPSDAPNGKVTVALARADTVSEKAGTYYYGLARTDLGGWDVEAQGKLVLRKAAVH